LNDDVNYPALKIIYGGKDTEGIAVFSGHISRDSVQMQLGGMTKKFLRY